MEFVNLKKNKESMIKFGSIEYHALVELGEKLSHSDYKGLGLEHLDRLKFEVIQKIEEINKINKEKIRV